MIPKVSVIIPVFNVEMYIEKCARSLFEQTLDSLEYIFVDDCSHDNSINVIFQLLKEYPKRKDQVVILHNEQNLGVSMTRQRGIDYSTGEYVIHCDPDDWIELDMYEKLYHKAKEVNCEILVCDYCEEWPDKSINYSQSVKANKHDMLIDIITGNLHTYLWDKLILRDFILKSGCKMFADISLWEDMLYIISLLASTKKIIKYDKVLYHYRRGIGSSLTGGLNKEKEISKIKAVEHIVEMFQQQKIFDKFSIELKYLMVTASVGFISSTKILDPNLWRNKNSISTKELLQMPIGILKKIFYILALNKKDRMLLCILKLLNR